MNVVTNLNEDVTNDPPQLTIIDLCDHVLIQIFSYLDLHDKCFIIPQVCRRFGTVSTLCAPKHIVSRELQATKWNETNTSALFRKIGPSLRSIIVSYSLEEEGGPHLEMMLTEIRKNCVNIVDLHIIPSVRMSHIIGLPTTIRKIELDFVGSSLNLEYLNNLEILHLLVARIPTASDWIKVENRLKNIELNLSLEEIPNNISTIAKLMTSISDNYSVSINIFDESGYHYPFILLDPVKHVSNVVEFSIIGFDVRNDDVNEIVQHFAEANTIKELHLGCITCKSNAPPVITLKTIDSLLRCTSLELVEFNSTCYVNSMIAGFMKRLNLNNIRLQYGFVGHTQHHIQLSLETFENIVEFFGKIFASSDKVYPEEYEVSYRPLDRCLNLAFQVKNRKLWNSFSKLYVEDASQFRWIREHFYVQIDAGT